MTAFYFACKYGYSEIAETLMKKCNRTNVLDLFNCINDEERSNLNKMLNQASVIIGVTNRIGKIKVQAFQKYVKNAYMHWMYNFHKFVHMKSSLHWTLGHVAELIAKNEGYILV